MARPLCGRYVPLAERLAQSIENSLDVRCRYKGEQIPCDYSISRLGSTIIIRILVKPDKYSDLLPFQPVFVIDEIELFDISTGLGISYVSTDGFAVVIPLDLIINLGSWAW